MKNLFSDFRSRSFRAGGYSILVCALTLAIVIAVNLLAAALPESLTRKDVTEAGLFTLSRQSEELVENLGEDTTVYWVVQAGQEDVTLEQLLNRYSALSDRLTVIKMYIRIFSANTALPRGSTIPWWW